MASEATIRVMIADDSADLRSILRECLQREGDIKVVKLLDSADGLEEAVESQSPDVLLIDLTMPGRDPLDAIRQVTASHPEARVVVCSGYDDDETIDGAMAAGATGFVSKHSNVPDIVAAVRRAATGESFTLR